MSPSRRSARELSTQLRTFHVQGREAFGLALRCDDFRDAARARLERRLRRAGLPVDDAGLAAAARLTFGVDLFLAVACERDVPGAWQTLIGRHAGPLHGALIHHGASAEEAAEIVADLPGHLLATRGRSGGASRLAGYLGTGRLASWLTTVALRRFARRARERLVPVGLLWDAAGDGSSPSGDTLAVADERRRAFGDVLGELLGQMPVRERLALRFRFSDGLDLREIAALFGVGVPRVSRIVERAVAHLRRVVPARLADAAWPDDDVGVAELRDELAAQLRCVPSPTDGAR